MLKITVYEHTTWDPNYDGRGPIWYNGPDIYYSFIPNDYDHVKEQGINIKHTPKQVKISSFYLQQLIYEHGPYDHIIAEKLFYLNEKYEKECIELYNKLVKLDLGAR